MSLSTSQAGAGVRLFALQQVQSLFARSCAYRIRFQSVQDERVSLEFPCDAEGHVELDALDEHARADYLFARAVVGGEFRRPAVVAIAVDAR